jgi:undecaprenyl-diphosphatase
MPLTHAIILGVVQGLTEVLPISSSAHLVLFPWLWDWHYQGLSFDVALHLGTASAFLVYFWKDWLGLFKRDTYLLWCIVLATIPAALAGAMFEKQAETVFRSPLIIMLMLAVFAIVLWWADSRGKKEKTLAQMDIKTAFTIGLAQVLALIPGVSRSGITITAGLYRGLSREAAARFSFLLAAPIVIAAAILKLPKLQSADLTLPFWLGIFFSSASGLLAIRFLLRFVQKASFRIFVLYRLALAAIIIIIFFSRR